jgi:lysine 2,3-aminomutase
LAEDNTKLVPITNPANLSRRFHIDASSLEAVTRKYPMRITQHYFSLIEEPGDPIWRQCVPSIDEMNGAGGTADPLGEERDCPVPWLVHRYPDRVLMRVSNRCATYCRFCTRKREVGDARKSVSLNAITRQLKYIKDHREIRDVILSGGDPLMLSDMTLEAVLSSLRRIPHVEIIRIGTRVPCTLPERVNENLCRTLRKYHPLYMNIHFNHPREINDSSAHACGLLADAGLPLGSQTVLLKGVNDDLQVMRELLQRLLRIRVKPYYLFQMDDITGGQHFKTRVETGLAIIREIIGHTSGLAVPHFVVDAPGGGGKVPILPNYIEKLGKDRVTLRNYQDRTFEYSQPSAIPSISLVMADR